MFLKVTYLLQSFIQLQKGKKQLDQAHRIETIPEKQSLKEHFKQIMSNVVMVSET